jgi:hypothetical protein
MSLLGAHVGGVLDLSRAQLTSSDQWPALNAERLTVDQNMVCRDGFTADGGVSLLGAHVGQLILEKAELTGTNGPAA